MKIVSRSLPLFVLLTACGSGGGPLLDSGAGRDARIADSSLVVDSSLPRDASATDSSADAGISDAGLDGAPDAALACGGRCDPVAGRCAVGVCLLDSSGPRCAATSGLAIDGSRCAAVSDCAAGLSCFLTRLGGVCAPLCCPAASFEGSSTCDPGSRCGGTGMLIDGTVTAFRRCITPRPCDVLDAASACDRDEGCYIVDADGTTDCRAAGAATVGAACVDQNDCAPGFACSGLVEPRCVRICSLRISRMACPTGEGECIAHSQSPPGTGLCTLVTPATP